MANGQTFAKRKNLCKYSHKGTGVDYDNNKETHNDPTEYEIITRRRKENNIHIDMTMRKTIKNWLSQAGFLHGSSGI